MKIGEPLRELHVEPLLYPAAMPEAPMDPESPSVPEQDPVEASSEQLAA